MALKLMFMRYVILHILLNLTQTTCFYFKLFVLGSVGHFMIICVWTESEVHSNLFILLDIQFNKNSNQSSKIILKKKRLRKAISQEV